MNYSNFSKHLLIGVALCCSLSTAAQGTAEDYNRANGLRQKYSANLVYYSGVEPHWVGNTSFFWYIRNTPQGREYVKVDAEAAQRTPLFDQQKLAEALGRETSRTINAMQLPLGNCRVDDNFTTLCFEHDGKRWAYNIQENTLKNEGAIPQRGKQRHWMEVDDEKGGAPVASPDSKRVATVRIRSAKKRFVYYVESSPSDQLQPRLHKQEYAKPGDELAFRVPCIFEVETSRALIPSTELFGSQYWVTAPQWNADSQGITFEYNERGHKVY